MNQIDGRTATLGDALKTLGVDAHPALKKAFSSLYCYTSAADGIRHVLGTRPFTFSDSSLAALARV